MESSSEHDRQLTPEQLTWAAQVNLAAAMTLWASLPGGEKQELIDEVLEQFDDAHIWAYAVLFVESLGFDVQPPLVPVEDYEPEADSNAELTYAGDQLDQLKTGLYL